MIDLIKDIIQEHIRPILNMHNGDIEVLSFSGGVLRVKFKGNCEGCPSAKLTLEELVSSTIKGRVPEVSRVECVDSIPDDAYILAKMILGSNK